jgi:hypothetical protein
MSPNKPLDSIAGLPNAILSPNGIAQDEGSDGGKGGGPEPIPPPPPPPNRRLVLTLGQVPSSILPFRFG